MEYLNGRLMGQYRHAMVHFTIYNMNECSTCIWHVINTHTNIQNTDIQKINPRPVDNRNVCVCVAFVSQSQQYYSMLII